LAALAQEQSARERGLNKVQDEALGKNRRLRAVFYLLGQGWTPAQIAAEFDLTNTIEAMIDKLQALGLIRRVSSQRVKILARPNLTYKSKGLMADYVHDRARQFLSEINLRDDQCDWLYNNMRLSRSSAARLHEMIQRFQRELHAIRASEPILPADQVQWYRIFLGAQPIARGKILPPG